MLRSLTKTRSLSAQVVAATKQGRVINIKINKLFCIQKKKLTFFLKKIAPRFSSAFIHTQPLYENNTVEDNAPIHALGARLGLQSLDSKILKQALTHKSVSGQDNNESLEFIGKRVTGLFATEFVHCKYPVLHPGALNATLRAYIGNKSFNKIATEVGLQHTITWKAPEDESVKLGQATVMADCMNALIGAIYQEQGLEAAKKFIHNFVLSRDFDVKPFIKVEAPKRHLSALLRQFEKEPAESRLLSETGRTSSSPVFIIGVFSGKEKLGEGFGSSLKMAEFRVSFRYI